MVATSTAQSGDKAGLAALDVQEFLAAEIGAETGFGDDVIGKFERGGRRQHRIAAMRDVGERPAVNEGRRAFERLHQIRRQRLFKQHGHGAMRFQIAGADRFAVAGIGDDDVAKPLLQIFKVAGQTEDRHDLRGDGDVETILARKSVGDAAERRDDLSATRDRSCRAHAATPRAADRYRAHCPNKCDYQSCAASRLFAEVMAWKSPVKCRLMSSIGTTCA